MIGWLRGESIDIWQQGLRKGILLNCSGVGYEIQLLPRVLPLLKNESLLELWIHQVNREDSIQLYGFQMRTERDLFRLLISVSGIGPQSGLALLEENNPDELITAILQEDLSKLSKAQGIGKKTAQRLSIELNQKLIDFTRNASTTFEEKPIRKVIPMNSSSKAELEETLKSLGYKDNEICQALIATTTEPPIEIHDKGLSKAFSREETDSLLKNCLLWLSQKAA